MASMVCSRTSTSFFQARASTSAGCQHLASMVCSRPRSSTSFFQARASTSAGCQHLASMVCSRLSARSSCARSVGTGPSSCRQQLAELAAHYSRCCD